MSRDLFAPLVLGKATLPNRLAVAPMTTSQSQPDGKVSEAEAAWLERLAKEGYGMVITCAAAISRTSIAFHDQMSLGSEEHMPGLGALAARLSAHPGLSVVQLCHGGSRAIPSLTGQEAHSASRYELPAVPGFVPPRELSVAQIEEIVQDHVTAAERAARAGFGGVELHGANGYLLTQFISTMTNLRHDAWGGSVENRARLSREIVRAIRRRVPSGFVLGFRISLEGGPMDTGLDLDENVQIVRWLAEDGIDYAHVSSMNMFAPSAKRPTRTALEVLRAGVGASLPVVAAGGVMSREAADAALALGADVVAVGRGAIGNADVPERFRRNEPLTPMPYDPGTLRGLAVSAGFQRYLETAIPISRMGILRA